MTTVIPAMPGAARRWAPGLRRHWLIVALLVLATLVRAVVLLAYRPALVFPDTRNYLMYAQRFASGHWTPDVIRSSGYSILIVPETAAHLLALIPLVQHLLGLAEGVMIYAVLIRFGCRRWLAAIAAVPVLFDPLQLDLEQYVLSDVFAAFFVVTALVVLVWKGREIGRGPSAVFGLLLGAATVTRQNDLVLIIPAVLYLAIVVRPWRRLAALGGILAGCFLLIVGGYAGWYKLTHREVALSGYNGTFLYGRVVQFADCAGLRLPAYERPLCPAPPPAQRNPDFYTWSPQSPQWTFQPPPGTTRQSAVLNFSLRVVAHQPLTYLKVVGADVAYGFSPVRGDGPEHYPVAYLKFQTGFPPYAEVHTLLPVYGHTGPAVQPALSAFLVRYGRVFYIPGPVLAAALLLGVIGLAARRSRGRGQRAAAFVFTASVVTVLVSTAASAAFDWRYELPQLTLIPVAGALGATALAGWRRPSPAGEPGPEAAPTTSGFLGTTARST